MMRVFRYRLRLLDPLFYAREGLSGAFSPKHIHSTAINCAVAYALNIEPESQPYITSDTPSYENSKVVDEFYFTPARPEEEVDYLPEIAKGEADGFIRLGFGGIRLKGRSISRPEVLKRYQLFFIPPETTFSGYLIEYRETNFPELIRLGSFRGKANLELSEVKAAEKVERAMVAHPVDPLVSKVVRGVMVNILPYPIAENATCEGCLKIREMGLERFIALPWREEPEKKRISPKIAIV